MPTAPSWLHRPIPGWVGWCAYAVILSGGLGVLIAYPLHGGTPWLLFALAGWVIAACLLLRVATRARASRPVWARVGPLSVVVLVAVGGLDGVGFAQTAPVSETSARQSAAPAAQWTVPYDPMALVIDALSAPRDFPAAGSCATRPCVPGAPAVEIACWSTPLTLPRATAAVVTMFDHLGFYDVTTTCAGDQHSCAASGSYPGGQTVDASIAVGSDGGCVVRFTWAAFATPAPVGAATP